MLNTTNGHSHPVPASGAIPPQDHVSNYEPTQSVSVDLDPPSPLQGGSINSEEELGQLLNDSQDEGNESDDEEMDPFNDGYDSRANTTRHHHDDHHRPTHPPP